MAASSLLLLSIIIVSIRPLSCFSIGNGLDITSLIRSTCSDDATTLPPVLLDTITSRQTTNRTRRSGGSDECDSLTCSITISSDFQRPTRGTCSETSGPISVQQYTRYTSSRHADCIDLFDRYESSIIRCEKISNTRTPQAHVEEFNIRWEASWISASSVWLFDLADAAGWQIEKQVPDSSRVSSFSWMSVGQGFQKCHYGVFLRIAQPEITKLLGVDVQRHFRLRPATLGKSVGLTGEGIRAYRLDVPGIVEVYDSFQALEVTIVAEGFNKSRVRSFIDISQGRYFLLAKVLRGIWLVLHSCFQKTAQTQVIPAHTIGVERQLVIPWVVRVTGCAQVVIGEICE